MIKLTKRPKPQILIDNAATWTKELMGYILSQTKAPDTTKGRYRHIQIKEAVTLETKGKCAYCESQVTHQYPGDVEHIIPKAAFPRLTFIWSNLSFVCFWCNNNKHDTVDKNCKILNPYIDSIEDHLRAFGPVVMHINQSKRGEITHREIKLNRDELIDRRTQAIKDIQNLVDKFDAESSPALKEVLRQELVECTLAEKEYSFYIKQYLMDRGGIL